MEAARLFCDDPHMASKEFWQDQFEKKGNWPETWLMVADDLLAAGEYLNAARKRAWEKLSQATDESVEDATAPEFRFDSPALLLLAAAIEALLKGRAVRRKTHQFVVDGKFNRIPRSHDLVHLAGVTGFPLNANEERLLAWLSTYLELGRYPISTRWDAGLEEHQKPGVGLVVAFPRDFHQTEVFERLVRMLRAEVQGKVGRTAIESESPSA